MSAQPPGTGQPRTAPNAARADSHDGGDPACWAHRVCPHCGAFNAAERPRTCESCGADFESAS